MKKLIYLIALFAFSSIQLFAQYQHAGDSVGTEVTSAIRPNSPADNIATIYTNEARGTTHHYQTFAELEAMKSSRLVTNQLATVADSSGKIFQYNGSDWVALEMGGELPSWLFEGVTDYQQQHGDGFNAMGIRYKNGIHESFIGLNEEGSIEITTNYENQTLNIISSNKWMNYVDGEVMPLGIEFQSGDINVYTPNNSSGLVYYDVDGVTANIQQGTLIHKLYADQNYLPLSGTLTDNVVINFDGDNLTLNNIDNVNIEAQQNFWLQIKDYYFESTSTGLNMGTFGVGFTGLSYSDDYSANFTDRSVIDKGYGDAHYLSGSPDSTWITAVVKENFKTGNSYDVISATDTELALQNFSNGEMSVFYLGGGGAKLKTPYYQIQSVSGNAMDSLSIKTDLYKWLDYDDVKIFNGGRTSIVTNGYLQDYYVYKSFFLVLNAINGYVIDFGNPKTYNITLTDNLEFFPPINIPSYSETISVYLSNPTTARIILFPVEWEWIGAKPTQLAADETGVLTLQNFSATKIIASYVLTTNGE